MIYDNHSIRFGLICCLLAALLACANLRKNEAPQEIRVAGMVFDEADSLGVAEALVETEPASFSVRTNTNGTFIISGFVDEGDVLFIAEANGKKGFSKVKLERENWNMVKIIIGRELDMIHLPDWEPLVKSIEMRGVRGQIQTWP